MKHLQDIVLESLLDDEDDVVDQAFFADLKGMFDTPALFNSKFPILKKRLGKKLQGSQQTGWMIAVESGWGYNKIIVTDGETNMWTVSAMQGKRELSTGHAITNKKVISKEFSGYIAVYAIPADLEQLKVEISKLEFKVVQKI